MSLTGFVRSYWRRAALSCLEWRLARQPLTVNLERANWPQSLQEPTAFYFDCLRYFLQKLPAELRAHRAYFHNVPGNRRGFGENPFHVMWFLLAREFRPANFLEIGVFRGQTISLMALLARLEAEDCEVYGISPFVPAGDAAPFYRKGVDYYADTLANFDHFGLPHPKLVRAYSHEASALELISSKKWDLVYIDGGHDYEVVRKDWEACSRAVRPGGLVVLDDSAANTAFRPQKFAASRGLPGPSRVADKINRAQFHELLQVGHNRVFQRAEV